MKKNLIALLAGTVLLAGCSHVCPVQSQRRSSDVSLKADAYFDTNSAVLKKADLSELDKVAARLNENKSEKVELRGYTDSTGTEAYNLQLSKRRAEAVAKYLTDKGVCAKRITTEGFGETNFVDTNKTAAGRAKNRRVEIDFVK